MCIFGVGKDGDALVTRSRGRNLLVLCAACSLAPCCRSGVPAAYEIVVFHHGAPHRAEAWLRLLVVGGVRVVRGGVGLDPAARANLADSAWTVAKEGKGARSRPDAEYACTARRRHLPSSWTWLTRAA